jgi:biotin transporter BioY
MRKPTFDGKDSQLQAIVGKTGGFLPDNLAL